MGNQSLLNVWTEPKATTAEATATEQVLREKYAEGKREFSYLTDSKEISGLTKARHVWLQACQLPCPGRNRIGGIMRFRTALSLAALFVVCFTVASWATPTPERILPPGRLPTPTPSRDRGK